MKKWKTVQKTNKRRELMGVIGVTMCLIIGIICDWNIPVEKNNLVQVEDIESFSLAVIQIQVAIGTLIFSIIALMAGNISNSYMGVSISDFYLRIKPWKLTQKKLIIISLSLCLVSVVYHLLGFFNTVFCLFIATLIVVTISISEIYSAFKGKNKQNNEIEIYVNYMFEDGKEFEKKVDIFQNFVEDWEDVVDLQNRQSYDKFLEIFENGMSAIWAYQTEEALSAIDQQCYSMAYCFLKSEKKLLKARGIEFVQEIYNKLWHILYNCIKDTGLELNKYRRGFPFFAEICSDLIQCMDEMQVEDVEKRFMLAKLVGNVLKISAWLSYFEKIENKEARIGCEYNRCSDVVQLNLLAQYTGFYLRKQNNRNNIINQCFWADVLTNWDFLSGKDIPEERSEVFFMAVVDSWFSYCYGMLVNGQENILKLGLYVKRMRDVGRLDNKYVALLYLSVHCYIYYLVVNENDNCVSEEIRKSALNLWKDNEVRRIFSEFINILPQKSEWLDQNIYKQILEIVKIHERYPKCKFPKCKTIEQVTSDFYIFIVAFVSYRYCMPELVEKNIDDTMLGYYFSDCRKKQVKEIFKELFSMVRMENNSEDEESLLCNHIEKIFKEEKKRRYIKLAKKKQENYDLRRKEEIGEKIRKKVIKKIGKKFMPILVHKNEKNEKIEIKLAHSMKDTELVRKNICRTLHYSEIEKNFWDGIEKYLSKRKLFDSKCRDNDFANDMEYVKYLEENNLYLLLGSRSILQNRQYDVEDKYKSYLKNCKTIYNHSINRGIALKQNSIQVCLHDVSVSIDSQSINEEVKYDESTEKYLYPIDGLLIDFDKNELREFLYNNSKIINITATISIQVNEKCCGTIFMKKRF